MRTNTPTKKGDALALRLAPYWPDASSYPGRQTCALIARHTQTIRRCSEALCSYDGGEKWQARTEKAMNAAEKRVEALIASIGEGWEARHQGDCRGCVVYVMRPTDRRGDSYSDGIPAEL